MWISRHNSDYHSNYSTYNLTCFPPPFYLKTHAPSKHDKTTWSDANKEATNQDGAKVTEDGGTPTTGARVREAEVNVEVKIWWSSPAMKGVKRTWNLDSC